MPIRDPAKLRMALEHNFNVLICRECGAKNSISAKRCRKCKSTNLRRKRYRK